MNALRAATPNHYQNTKSPGKNGQLSTKTMVVLGAVALTLGYLYLQIKKN